MREAAGVELRRGRRADRARGLRWSGSRHRTSRWRPQLDPPVALVAAQTFPPCPEFGPPGTGYSGPVSAAAAVAGSVSRQKARLTSGAAARRSRGWRNDIIRDLLTQSPCSSPSYPGRPSCNAWPMKRGALGCAPGEMRRVTVKLQTRVHRGALALLLLCAPRRCWVSQQAPRRVARAGRRTRRRSTPRRRATPSPFRSPPSVRRRMPRGWRTRPAGPGQQLRDQRRALQRRRHRVDAPRAGQPHHAARHRILLPPEPRRRRRRPVGGVV